MVKRILLFGILGLLLVPLQAAFGQDTGALEGTVVDSTTTRAIPGANAILPELSMGAATDANGDFQIDNVPAGSHTLQVSFVGYETKSLTVEVSAGETTTVNVPLASSAVGMEEMVVTAMGQERSKRALSTTVQEVSGADIAQVDNDNFINSLEGRIAGADIRSASTMGGSTNITLRGISSISGDNQPLIVIDGIVIDNTTRQSADDNQQAGGYGGFDYGNPAQSINPADVKSISVLKGPAAAALYGSRGASGVIQITTKSGQQEEGLGVSYTSSVRASTSYEFMDYQNKYGGGAPNPFRSVDGDLRFDDDPVADFATDESWGPRMDGREVRQWYSFDDVNDLEGQVTPWDPSPDNIKNFLETGTTIENNIGLTHGGDTFQYRLGINTRNTDGVMPNSSLDRYQFTFNGSADLSEDLRATATAKYSTESAKGRTGTGYFCQNDECIPGTNPFAQFNTFGQRQYDLGPDSYMRDYTRPDGTQRGWNWRGVSGARDGVFNYTDNPYVARYENVPTDDTQRLYGKAQLAYDFIEDFTGSFMVTNDHYTERRGARVVELSSEDPPRYREDIIEVQEVNSELKFDYTQDLTDDLNLTTFAAGRVRWETFERNQQGTTEGLSAPGVYTVENSQGRPTIVDQFEEKLVYSTYGSINLGWRDMVYLETTLRNDWSSTLPAGENSFFYPSFSGNFIFTELEALQDQSILSFGKIRASWGRVGNDTSPYQLATTFPVNTPFGSQALQQVQRESNNPDLKPEQKTGYEVGADLRFLRGRVDLSATWYRDVTKNQIINVEISSASGVNSALLNAGEISNQGLETQLTVTPILRQDFEWSIDVNWATNTNKVESLAEGVSAITIGATRFGPTLEAREGEPFGVFVGNQWIRDANGEVVYDRNGNPQLTADTQVLGSFQADWSGGIGTSFRYKGLNVSALIDGQMGGKIWSTSNQFGLYSGLLEETVAGNQRQTGIFPDGVVLPENVVGDGISQEEAAEIAGTPYAEADGTQRLLPSTFWKNYFNVGGSPAFLYDATHVKLREISIAYSFSRDRLQSLLGDLPLQRATLSLTGRNLMTLYKEAPNIDPSITLGAGNIQGIEAGQIPARRTYGFRLNLAF